MIYLTLSNMSRKVLSRSRSIEVEVQVSRGRSSIGRSSIGRNKHYKKGVTGKKKN